MKNGKNLLVVPLKFPSSTKYLNEKTLAEDKDRIVSWNWCFLNEGVSYEDFRRKAKRAMKGKIKRPNLGLG
ncbi:MAG: hypothetical protein CM15mP109_09150 [Candidatus Dadabacteria bacterium]|nr:MAG: hypothetical protein CM15mP109_09150 [Candidatus Dadabacteria bacterium]